MCFSAVLFTHLYLLAIASLQINEKSALQELKLYPRVLPQKLHDVRFLSMIVKEHGYANGEINRMHFLGSFLSHQSNDELTAYLHYIGKLTTAVRLIYSYEKFLENYDVKTPIANYLCQPRHYCRFNLQSCGFVQFLFTERKTSFEYWESEIITKLHHSPNVPYFVVYISLYKYEETPLDRYKGMFLSIRHTSMGLYIVAPTANKHINGTMLALSIGCMHCVGHKHMVFQLPERTGKTMKSIWKYMHRKVNFGYLSSNFYFGSWSQMLDYAWDCASKRTVTHPRGCIISEFMLFYNLTSVYSIPSSAMYDLKIHIGWIESEDTVYSRIYEMRSLFTKLEYKFNFRFTVVADKSQLVAK